MSRTDLQFKLRLPPDLHTAIIEKAKHNKRSLNAEILSRLEASVLADDTFQSPVAYEGLTTTVLNLEKDLAEANARSEIKEPFTVMLKTTKEEILESIEDLKFIINSR